MAPETTAGRVFVILYGLIGVPLTLLTIADLGMFISLCLKKIIAAINKAVLLIKKCIRGKGKKVRPSQIEKKSNFKTIEKEEISIISDHKSILETAREGSTNIEEEEEQPQEPVARGTTESIALCMVFTVYLFFGAQVHLFKIL